MVVINWRKGQNIVDGGGIRPGSAVTLTSRGHTEVFDAYEIYERLPKFLWIARKDQWVTGLPARPLPPEQGRYTLVNPWQLPPPKDRENGRRKFFATAAGVVSATIESTAMRITSESRKTQTESTAEASGKFKPAPGTELSGKVGHKRKDDKEVIFGVLPTQDPRVEIRLLQAEDVQAHIAKLVDDWFGQSSDDPHVAGGTFSDGIADYFDSSPAEFEPLSREIGPPDSLSIPVRITPSGGLRAAMCLQIDDIDNQTTTISEPQFITEVDGTIVVSDLVPALFDDDVKSLAERFSQAGTKDQLSPEAGDLGAQLVVLLGTSDLDDAIALLSLQ